MLCRYRHKIHAAGHTSRLARKTLLENKGMMASGTARQTYAKEELVAEMGAAFLAAHSGIVLDDFENSAAYLKNWLEVLRVKDNRCWIVEAASQAQKATRYIRGELGYYRLIVPQPWLLTHRPRLKFLRGFFVVL